MEIIYIYIEDYKNIKKQSFQLSSEFNIQEKFDVNENLIGISIDKKLDYFNIFSKNEIVKDETAITGENEKVKNVTAIIGENGAGKSNFLDFIKENFPDGIGGLKYKCFVLIKDNQNRKIFLDGKSNIAYNNLNIDFDFRDNTNSFEKKNISDKSDANNILTTHPEIDCFYNDTFIFYSNIFDLKFETHLTNWKLPQENEQHSVTEFINISTNFLVTTDKEKYINASNIEISSLDCYKAMELQRNIQLITSPFKENLKFKLPEQLFININYNDELVCNKNSEFENIIKKINSYFLKTTLDFITLLKKAIIINQVVLDKKYSAGAIENDFFEKYFVGETFDEAFQNYWTKTIENSRNENKINKSRYVFEFIEIINNGIKNKTIIVNEYLKFIVIPVVFATKNKLINLLDVYFKELKQITDFLTFKWRNLSSGEQSLFTLYSRFYSLSDSQVINKLKSDVIVLIDEGDVYMHPKWQKEFLNDIITIIPKMLNRNIQFILTSNTPFLASDLPKSNIVFIEKNNEMMKVHKNKNNFNETFGSNIYSLFADSFYMDNGLIGEFAKEKINDVIEILVDDDLSKVLENEVYIRNIINVIGEPIVKRKLTNLLNDKLNNQD